MCFKLKTCSSEFLVTVGANSSVPGKCHSGSIAPGLAYSARDKPATEQLIQALLHVRETKILTKDCSSSGAASHRTPTLVML